ncbi:hypothetical protein [uncultured Roseivirga sp.]|uniref:hypothetical protein n=1 Tax=uncultured Roseivirga sp. TaxID=543088 RepID=UPI0030D88F4E|tara:strand:+ start:68271 stop:68894 length:624 start_codon:yes stop_codon:yes gene_type:complete
MYRRLLFISAVITLCSTLNAQSVYFKEGQRGLTATLSRSNPDFAFDKLFTTSLGYTLRGRIDIGIIYSNFTENRQTAGGSGGVNGYWLNRAEFNIITPTINYLIVKSKGGTNIGAGLGYNLVLGSVGVNDFVFNMNLSQRIGKIDKINLLPHYSLSFSGSNTASSLGASLVLPGKRYFVVTPSMVSGEGDSYFNLDLAYSLWVRDKK